MTTSKDPFKSAPKTPKISSRRKALVKKRAEQAVRSLEQERLRDHVSVKDCKIESTLITAAVVSNEAWDSAMLVPKGAIMLECELCRGGEGEMLVLRAWCEKNGIKYTEETEDE